MTQDARETEEQDDMSAVNSAMHKALIQNVWKIKLHEQMKAVNFSSPLIMEKHQRMRKSVEYG